MVENPLKKLYDELCNRAWAEGRVIKAAPITFCLGVLLTGIAISSAAWKIIDTLYLERLATQQATITGQQETISDLRARLADGPKIPVLQEPPGTIETILKLQFFGDTRIPVEVGEKNIHSWFAQFSPSLELRLFDKKHNEITPQEGAPKYGPTWNVFVTLEKPTKRRQVVAVFSNPEKMGPSEISGETDRSFIFHTYKEMPAGILELRAVE